MYIAIITHRPFTTPDVGTKKHSFIRSSLSTERATDRFYEASRMTVAGEGKGPLWPFPFHGMSPLTVTMAKGAGRGHGSGETTGEDVAAGSVVAIVFTVIMCVCGVPMIIAGFILIQSVILHTTGIALLTISAIMTVAAIVLIVLICTGFFSPKPSVQPVGVVAMPTGPVMATTYTSGQMMGPAPPPYQQTGVAPPSYVALQQQQQQPPSYVSPEQQSHNPYPPPNLYSAPPPVAGP
ncbi:hypothetical protein LSAT2_013089 [Lamellibrachia satsuma]|nr:hypothetical protein LSAT2_013089 [Lamellibrachia satsuma]